MPRGPKAGSVPETVRGAPGVISPCLGAPQIFHSRILALHGMECACSSHTALSLNTGFLFP